jgi:hypothetical protein
MALSWMLN